MANPEDMMKNTLRLGLILLVSSLASCASTSRSFVEGMSGYSVVRGRITEVQNLSADLKQSLGDGLAIIVSQPGCKVSMRFPDNQTKMLDLEPGMMIVYGSNDDFVLRSEFASPTR